MKGKQKVHKNYQVVLSSEEKEKIKLYKQEQEQKKKLEFRKIYLDKIKQEVKDKGLENELEVY